MICKWFFILQSILWLAKSWMIAVHFAFNKSLIQPQGSLYHKYHEIYLLQKENRYTECLNNEFVNCPVMRMPTHELVNFRLPVDVVGCFFAFNKAYSMVVILKDVLDTRLGLRRTSSNCGDDHWCISPIQLEVEPVLCLLQAISILFRLILLRFASGGNTSLELACLLTSTTWDTCLVVSL